VPPLCQPFVLFILAPQYCYMKLTSALCGLTCALVAPVDRHGGVEMVSVATCNSLQCALVICMLPTCLSYGRSNTSCL